ncbi:MAG: hypothetical protein JWP38_783 [Herbaspirillum sp.]|jgi:hypothetical protein|nr:hypothetical protein [Herbaspirillum sp.]
MIAQDVVPDFTMPPDAPVPARYRGVWQRTLLETPQMADTDTTVFWLQTDRWHADIRIPAGAPDFSGVASFAECSPGQLAWLAGQSGFAGFTQVDLTPSREICHWRRRLDFQPPRATPDAGAMRFGPAGVTETGVHSTYFEDWRRLPDSHDGFAVLQLLDARGAPAAPARFLMVAGSYVMQIRDRSLAWPAGAEPASWPRAVAERPELLDFELSFGHRTADGWRILHSTLPWRTGRSVSVRWGRERDGIVDVTLDGVPRNWKIREWNPPDSIAFKYSCGNIFERARH